jgi:GNAT superfamily N-acetyltransferase
VTTIRRATVDDAAALAALRWTWHHENQSEASEAFDDFVTNYCAWWVADQNSHHAVVAEVDGQLVGMGFLALLVRVPDVDHPRRADGDIQSVYVEPTLRGRGVGTQLVRELIAIADEMGCEKVTVQSSSRALSLYQHAGFDVSVRLLVRRSAN